MTATFHLLCGCATGVPHGGRILSAEEKKQFGLYGNINEAKICPTAFDETSGRQKVTGRCEIVTCTILNSDQVECRAFPEP